MESLLGFEVAGSMISGLNVIGLPKPLYRMRIKDTTVRGLLTETEYDAYGNILYRSVEEDLFRGRNWDELNGETKVSLFLPDEF